MPACIKWTGRAAASWADGRGGGWLLRAQWPAVASGAAVTTAASPPQQPLPLATAHPPGMPLPTRLPYRYAAVPYITTARCNHVMALDTPTPKSHFCAGEQRHWAALPNDVTATAAAAEVAHTTGAWQWGQAESPAGRQTSRPGWASKQAGRHHQCRSTTHNGP